jgi:GGDEF domain-containing protein/uncharacterized membrane protein (DUF485 family)
LSGLFDTLFPSAPAPLMNALKAGLGPLCCAMAMLYTGRWLNIGADDQWTLRIILWGSTGMGVFSIALALLATTVRSNEVGLLLLASALACLVTIVMTGICAWRAAMHGDTLALWITPTAVALTITIAGLYTQAAYPGTMSPGWIGLTAFCAIAYLLNIAALAIIRARQAKRLERLAGLEIGIDPATGLPTGSALISKVDDAFWRASRNRMVCNVVCMHLHNLYELGDLAGHGVEQQIAIAMSARIRRAVGFRCVVGLYHARCFVAVIPVPKESSDAQVNSFVQRLRYLISKPINVMGHSRTPHAFIPDWGIAVVSGNPNQQDSIDVLRSAERQAMQPGNPGNTGNTGNA